MPNVVIVSRGSRYTNIDCAILLHMEFCIFTRLDALCHPRAPGGAAADFVSILDHYH